MKMSIIWKLTKLDYFIKYKKTYKLMLIFNKKIKPTF